jgi:hypothetical protein
MIFKFKRKEETEQSAPVNNGGRNLFVLAIIAITIAITTTSISLTIYRVTGDVYLDRSRPGYIDDDEVHSTEDDGKESFANEGPITSKELDEYLQTLDTTSGRIDNSLGDFSEAPLSDETLGLIMEEQPAEDAETEE